MNSKIGQAIIVSQSNTEVGSDAVNAGFYAAAYDWNGQTVISYRGTNADTASKFRTDALNGYGLGAGYPYNDQAWLAAQFYQSVTGKTNSDPRSANVILTGHSLGGGLAGFIASIYGQHAFIFDNMTFEGAAQRLYGMATSSFPPDQAEYALDLEIWGNYFNGLTPWAPLGSEFLNVSDISAHETELV